MAMFTCPDCGTKVSTSAVSCPKCGRPVTPEDSKPKKKSWFRRIVFAVLVLTFIGGYIHEYPRLKAEQQAADEAYKAIVVTVDNKVLKDKLLKKFNEVIRPEVKKAYKKAGLPEPKEYTLVWKRCEPGDYQVWVLLDGGVTPKISRKISSMVIGQISSTLLFDFKVSKTQLAKEDTYVSAYVFSSVLGRDFVNGGQMWNLGDENATPSWVSPEDAKKYLNIE